jgi:hypothetical protein
MLTIEDATPEDAQRLAAALRDDDAAELRAAGLTVQQALTGVRCQALRYDGELVALFGCQPFPGKPDAGVPWMLCTQVLPRVPRRAMAMLSDQVLSGWQATHAELSNLVHRRNEQALRFVRWLGFNVHPQPCGPGAEFFLFDWRRSCVTP